jgi:hypothetical protein
VIVTTMADWRKASEAFAANGGNRLEVIAIEEMFGVDPLIPTFR